MVAEQSLPVEGILLVPGDGALRDFCRDCLKQQGFRTLEAEDVFEALLIAASRENPVDFFITDLDDAQVSGLELSAMLRSISPNIRVVVLAGSAEKKRQAVTEQVCAVRKARSAAASQSTRRVVTSR